MATVIKKTTKIKPPKRNLVFEITLNTSYGNQLWNGRHKVDNKPYIPGIHEFDSRLKTLANEVTDKSKGAKEKIERLNQEISNIKITLNNWQARLVELKKSLYISNTKASWKASQRNVYRVNFNSLLTTQLALVIAHYDELYKEATLIEEMVRTLDIPLSSDSKNESQKYFKKIRTIIYDVMN